VPPIRLYLDHSDPAHVFRFRRPDGTPAYLPGLRLKIYVNLSALVRPGPTATHAAYPDCILDTGAYLTIIPERVWQYFRPRVVTPLPFDTAMLQRLRDITLPGGTFPYQLAEVTIQLQDLSGNALNVTLVAQLTRDGGRLTIPMVLGLRGGALDGRILRAEPDAAAPFGQAWMLEEP
jgi:hypothetical protein